VLVMRWNLWGKDSLGGLRVQGFSYGKSDNKRRHEPPTKHHQRKRGGRVNRDALRKGAKWLLERLFPAMGEGWEGRIGTERVCLQRTLLVFVRHRECSRGGITSVNDGSRGK